MNYGFQRFSGCFRHRYELLAKLFGEPTQGALFGFQHLVLVVREPMFDVIDAFDHYPLEQDGEFARQSNVGDQAATARSHTPVEAPKGDILAAR